MRIEVKEVEVDGGGGGGLERLKSAFPGGIKLCVRFSTGNLKLERGILTVLLFLADQTDQLIGLALSHMKEQESDSAKSMLTSR